MIVTVPLVRSPRCRLVLSLVLLAGFLSEIGAAAPEGKRYAVLVGVNRYEHGGLTPLRFAENDATELARLLEKAGYEVTLLTTSAKAKSRQPTRENIESRLRSVLEKCKRGDAV